LIALAAVVCTPTLAGNLRVSYPAADCLDKVLLNELADYMGNGYKVAPYLRATVAFQRMGKDDACSTLHRIARGGKYENQVILLCRILLSKNEGEPFEPSRHGAEFLFGRLGNVGFLGGTDHSDWPLEPIELVDDVPFLIIGNCMYLGTPERAESYLEYYLENMSVALVTVERSTLTR
jgi:hypothetical protein